MEIIFLETCLFEDQPGYVAKENKTCNDMIVVEKYHYKCYRYHEQCCSTCAVVAELYSNLTSKYLRNI